MDASLINLIILAAIAVMLLGPKEVYRLAYKFGRWMREVQKMSEEFQAELTREADAIEEREKSKAVEKNVFAAREDYSPDEMKNYHAGAGESRDEAEAHSDAALPPPAVTPSPERLAPNPPKSEALNPCPGEAAKNP